MFLTVIWTFFIISMILGALESKIDTYLFYIYGLVILYITYIYKSN